MRRQRLAPVLGAALVGGALLVPGIARAAAPAVAFHGGCGLLGVGAASNPDEAAVTVRAGGTVTFINHLDQAAHLMINGADRGSVPRDNQVSVLFRQGRVAVALLPGCLLGGGGDVGTVTVVVTPVVDRAAPRTADSVASQARPATVRSPEAKATASPAAAPAGGPAAGDPVAPAPAGGTGTAVDPSAGRDVAGAEPGLDQVAVGAVAPAPPVRPRPAGLLVFVAGICVVGVSIAATRAIISQRAIRMVAA